MHDQLEEQLFKMVASAHVASGGIIRVSKRGYDWGILHIGDDISFMPGKFRDINRCIVYGMRGITAENASPSDGGVGSEPQGTVYATPEKAVAAFVRHFALMGAKHEPNTSHGMDDTEFFFDGIHANVAVTWRHLKARFKGIKMILKRTDRRVMEDIIEEAASL